jgi:glucose dehydrogenase
VSEPTSSTRRIRLAVTAAVVPVALVATAVPASAADVEVTPSGDAPGIEAATNLVGGLLAYAGLFAVAAVLLGGIAWALGERVGLDRASQGGKMGVIAGLGLGFLTGAAVGLVNRFSRAGGGEGNLTVAANAPGYDIIQPVVGWLISYGALAALAAVILGGIGWALGERLGFDRMSLVGKAGIFVGLGLGLLTGASVTLVNFFINSGAGVS